MQLCAYQTRLDGRAISEVILVNKQQVNKHQLNCLCITNPPCMWTCNTFVSDTLFLNIHEKNTSQYRRMC